MYLQDCIVQRGTTGKRFQFTQLVFELDLCSLRECGKGAVRPSIVSFRASLVLNVAMLVLFFRCIEPHPYPAQQGTTQTQTFAVLGGAGRASCF